MNAIETNQLTRAFGSLVAVDDLTLAIPEGTVFGFLGPNGAGKTTTNRAPALGIDCSHSWERCGGGISPGRAK